MNILLVEDERSLSDVLVALLKRQNYTVDAVYDGEAGEDCAATGIYDVMILDIMLPKKNGLEVLRDLRAQGISTPVLLLTAKAEVHEKIAGLDHGADDYLTKPFNTGELLARIRAMTRRKGEFTGDELTFRNMLLNKRTRELSVLGNAVKLGAKEYQIMEVLMAGGQQVIEKERLMEKVWGYDAEAEYNAIEVYISFLRKKMTAIAADVQIRAVRGVGYQLEASE